MSGDTPGNKLGVVRKEGMVLSGFPGVAGPAPGVPGPGVVPDGLLGLPEGELVPGLAPPEVVPGDGVAPNDELAPLEGGGVVPEVS